MQLLEVTLDLKIWKAAYGDQLYACNFFAVCVVFYSPLVRGLKIQMCQKCILGRQTPIAPVLK